LFDQLVVLEIDVPSGRDRGLRQLTRRLRFEGGAGIVLGDLFAKTVGASVGPETDGRLVGFALAKSSHVPGVWRNQLAIEHLAPHRLAAAFELHEALQRPVEPIDHRRGGVFGSPTAFQRQSLGLGRGGGAVHPQVDGDERKGAREVDGRPHGASDGDEHEDHPERGLAEHPRPPR
jgi:hypothetical protein